MQHGGFGRGRGGPGGRPPMYGGMGGPPMHGGMGGPGMGGPPMHGGMGPGMGGPPMHGGMGPGMQGGGVQQPTQLSVTVISATNLPKRSGFMDKTDPYVEITVGGDTKKTSVAKKAGSNATYNETLVFSYNGQQSLTVTVKDKDLLKDDFIGTGTLPIANNTPAFQGVVPIYDKKSKSRGEVTLHLHAQ